MTEVKQSTIAKIRQYPHRIREVLLSFIGILLFAGFIHQPFPLILVAIGGLVGTAAVISSATRKMTMQEAFGITKLTQKVLIYILPAIALGIVLGIFTRNRFELTLLPASFTGLALVAPLVGSSEELLFRGYIQGQLRPVGRIFSIVVASSLHTSYKLLVILSLAMPLQFDFIFLIFWTFAAGVLIGILRELAGNTLPPMIAHAVFDIVLYGGMATAPVWVWS